MGYGYRFRVELDCGHVVTYPVSAPKPGEEVWCARCDTGRTVVDSAGRPTRGEEEQ